MNDPEVRIKQAMPDGLYICRILADVNEHVSCTAASLLDTASGTKVGFS